MSLLDTLAAAVKKQEGYYPGSLAFRNNNPGNLVYAGQRGASPGEGGFAKFPSYEAGNAALYNQINLDASRGMTLSQFVSKYESGEPAALVQTYLNNMSTATGIQPNQKLSDVLSLDSAPVIDSTVVDATAVDTGSTDTSTAGTVGTSFFQDISQAATSGDVSTLTTTETLGILAIVAVSLYAMHSVFSSNS